MEDITILGGSYASFYKAMTASERSMSIATSNLANADTPGYKAKALDFKQTYEGAAFDHALKISSQRHIQSVGGMSEDVKYRDNPVVRADDNTVNVAVEQMEIKRSSQNYELALSTMKGKKNSLSEILGEK